MKRKIGLLLTVMVLVLSIFGNSVFIASADDIPVIKNVIYMIPDGGGFAPFDFANGVKENGGFNAGLYPNSTTVEAGPMNLKNYLVGTETTHSASNSVTDSAAAGTALSSGYKTNNAYIGVDPQGVPHATILEAAQLAGKKAGIVSTFPWHHATPAAFTAHNISRNNLEILSQQIVNQGLDVVLGAGFGGLQWGNINEVINRGYTVVNNKAELASVTQGTKLWGNIVGANFPDDIYLTDTQPTLKEMTDAAICALSGSENGFFLMVEGSKVDAGGHANDIVQNVSEFLAFDAAFKVALDYAKSRNDTIVIVAPDHDSGGLNLPNKDAIGGNPNYQDYSAAIAEVKQGINSTNGISWTSKNHSARRCGIWMYLPDGINPPRGLSDVPGDNTANRNLRIDNIEIAPYIAELIGVNLGDATRQLFVDVTSEGHYDLNTSTFTFHNADISIVANQSCAIVKGETVDLNGEVAVYSEGRFYVPQSLLALVNENTNFVQSTRYIDESTGKVLVKGMVDKSFAGKNVTLLLLEKDTQNITKNAIGYVDQGVINRDGSYIFKFIFNGDVDDYELKMFLGNELINDSIIEAVASYSWLDANIEIVEENDISLLSRLCVNNRYNIEGLTYTMCLAFYDSNNRLIGASVMPDIKTVEERITTDSFYANVPSDTKRVKAMAWSDHIKMIPICKSATIYKSTE